MPMKTESKTKYRCRVIEWLLVFDGQLLQIRLTLPQDGSGHHDICMHTKLNISQAAQLHVIYTATFRVKGIKSVPSMITE